MKPIVFETDAAYRAVAGLAEPLFCDEARLLEDSLYQDRLNIFWKLVVPFALVTLAVLGGIAWWLRFDWQALLLPMAAVGVYMATAYPSAQAAQMKVSFPSPPPEMIRRTREEANLSTVQAASLVYRTARNWQQWEAGERAMDPALWELFRLKLTLNTVRSTQSIGDQ